MWMIDADKTTRVLANIRENTLASIDEHDNDAEIAFKKGISAGLAVAIGRMNDERREDNEGNV